MRLTKTNQDDVDIRFFMALESQDDSLIYVKHYDGLYQVVRVGDKIVCPMIAASTANSNYPHRPMQRFLSVHPSKRTLEEVLLSIADNPQCQIYAFQSHLVAMQFVKDTLSEFLGGKS
jgi:hypothetical protein